MIKKAFKLFLLFITFIMILSATAYAVDADTELRVRIRRPRKFNEQVDLKGYGSIGVYDISLSSDNPIAVLGENIDVLLDTFYNNKYLIQDETDDTTMIGPYHIKLNDYEYLDYNTAMETANILKSSYGISFYPFYNGSTFNIYGGSFINEFHAINNKDTVASQGVDCEVVNGLNKLISVYDSYNNIVLMYNSNFNIYFTSYNNELACNSIIIDKNTYRGMMAFSTEVNKLISINKVSLDYYLNGVIANEISAVWPIEAIKAQVLAARTYAVANLNPYSSVGYDLQDNQNSQVYGGYGSEKAITNDAVKDTDGQMIYYNDKLITAFFHSTSGGRTENSENIWMTPLPYLKAVDDSYSNISPYTQWQKTATKQEIADRLKETVDNNIADVYNIVITSVSENERVLECIISTNVGDITLKKEEVRTTLGTGMLLSSWFMVTTDCDVFLISESTYKLQNADAEEPTDSLLDSKSDYDTSDSLIEEPAQSYDDFLLDDSLLDDNTDIDTQNDEQDNINDAIQNSEIENIDDKRVSLNGMSVISSEGTSKLKGGSLNVISASGKSTLSTIPTIYYFDGRGWGHGVGMSQYGAKKMAEEGFTYEQILKHYYTGVEIK